MRALLVAKKALVDLWREPKLLVMMFAFPVGFLVVFAAAGARPLLRAHKVLACELTEPAPPADPAAANAPCPPPHCTSTGPGSEDVLAALRGARFDDGRSMFEIEPAAGGETAERALRDKTAAALVVIGRDAAGGRVISLRGDALNADYLQAATLLGRVLGRRPDDASGGAAGVRVVERPVGQVSTRTLTEFDFYACGLLVFAMLFLIPQTAQVVAREIRWKTLRRLRLTRLRAFDLFAGITVAQLLCGLAIAAMMLGAATLLGVQRSGSLVLVFAACMGLAFSAVGIGFVMACFVKNDGQALNVGGGVMMVQVFLSGALFPIPAPTMFTVAGHQIGAFDVFPATHGVLALQQVLGDGAGLDVVGFRLGATVLLSLVYFAAGIALFQRLRMREGSTV